MSEFAAFIYIILAPTIAIILWRIVFLLTDIKEQLRNRS